MCGFVLYIVQKCKSSTWYTCAFTHLYIKIPECERAGVCVCVFCVSVCTLVFVGSVDREACSILFAQGLKKKHMALARERFDMNLLKATWPDRIQHSDHDSTKHFNTLCNNRAAQH